MSVEERQRILRACADAIEAAAAEIAEIECSNTGIPLAQIRNGAAIRAAGNFRFFADYIGQMAGELYEQARDYLTLVRREPVGVAEIGEHTSELQSLMRTSYAVFCLKNKNNKNPNMTN